MGQEGGKAQGRGKVRTQKGKGVNSVNSSQFIDKLSCFYTNADQFRNKFSEFQIRIRDSKPLIIGITEVKPKNSQYRYSPAEFSMDWCDDYNMFSLNIDNDIGRGMILYVHKMVSAEEVEMETEFQENLFLRIKLHNQESMLVGLIYRSDSGSEENNTNLRTLIAEASDRKFAHYLMMGDFNYPGIDWNVYSARRENSEEQKFVECILDNYMFQFVHKPTRWRGTNTPNVLDLIITKDEFCIDNLEYQSPLGKSDHCVIIFDYICYVPSNMKAKERRNYRKADYESMRKELDTFDWESYLRSDSIDEMWTKFCVKIYDIEQKYVPLVKIGGSKKRQIPLDKETVTKIKEKNSLSRKFLRTKDPAVRKKYNRVRNQVVKLTRRARKTYERNLSQEAKSNPKRIWQYINSKSKTRQGISDLCVDPRDPKSAKTDHDENKANILAEFFSSVFTVEPQEDVPSLEIRSVLHEWSNVSVRSEDIEKILKGLKPDKSPGLDNLQPRLLKELSTELSKPLALIFSRSIQDRRVPEDWKKAKISAIFKKGNKAMAGNYRPVSLTSIVCKVLERVIRDRIIEHMEMNSLFTSKQYGFMSGRSTALQLLRVLDEWTEALDEGAGIDCIYMDYMKAFDTVPHRRLLKKLEAYKIGNDTIEWIENYLNGRTQQVSVNGTTSKWHRVTSGIPQGSVIGPLLFVIFINDLPDIVESTVYLFADDTKIFKLINTRDDKETLQRDLNRLTEWSETWLLRFHPEKCKQMHIGRHNPDPEYTFKLLNKTLELVEQEKDIGVVIDSNLSFDNHISEKVKKANSMFAIIRRIFYHLDEKTFTPLYKSLVRVHLDYASSVWAPYKAKYIDQIEGVQRRATKQLPGMSNLSYPERLRKLKLPTLSYRRIRGDMIEIYKIVSGKYDKTAGSFIRRWEDNSQRSGNRGNSRKLYPLRARLDIRKYSFSVRTTQVWNSLPDEVVCAKSLNSFKNRLDKWWENQELVYDNYKSEINITGSRNKLILEESNEEDPAGT